jgi:hypothetical protein
MKGNNYKTIETTLYAFLRLTSLSPLGCGLVVEMGSPHAKDPGSKPSVNRALEIKL